MSLFPGYCFVWIELQWTAACRCIGVVGLIMGTGQQPAKVTDSIIDGLRAREKNGFVVLPPKPTFRPGDPVRVIHGPLAGRLGLYEGMRARQRVEVLLGLLRVNVPRAAIEAVNP
jgi:transcription antitermination factor NusG